ncbi:MAG: histone deacetylase [Acidobacteria bacterium]|nr:histone deacetylase [Acidobacteriota bacterium]
MKIVYSDRYAVDLGAHVFPTAKYAGVHAALLARGLAAPADVVAPPLASWDQLALAHTRDYLEKIRIDRLSPLERAQLEIPATPPVVEWFRLMAGGTILAAREALSSDDHDRATHGDVTRTGAPPPPWAVGMHLGGGFHHAFGNHGEGFCMINDVAVAIRALKQDRLVSRVAVVDCDVHQGNGTAMIFAADRCVFTFSIHQERNYPGHKPQSSLDIGLDDGAGDEEYLSALARALPRVFASLPEIVFFVAGADPYEADQLGGLSLTRDGLRRRDRMVFEAARASGVPVVVTLAGGYAARLADTVAIHVATVEEALAALSVSRV